MISVRLSSNQLVVEKIGCLVTSLLEEKNRDIAPKIELFLGAAPKSSAADWLRETPRWAGL